MYALGRARFNSVSMDDDLVIIEHSFHFSLSMENLCVFVFIFVYEEIR